MFLLLANSATAEAFKEVLEIYEAASVLVQVVSHTKSCPLFHRDAFSVASENFSGF